MSHVACVDIEVRDLDVLEEAAKRCGLRLVRGQRTHKWYGRFLNDWHSDRAASKKGRDPSKFGTCDHALVLANAQPHDYEVGVTGREDGTFDLVYDSFGAGRSLEAAAGVDLERLQNEYLAITAEDAARAGGAMVEREELADGIRLRVYA